MKRAALAALALLATAAPALGDGPPRPPSGRPMRVFANPSAVIAAEIAFARLARDKGQWTAFRDTAAEGAEMFVPQRILAMDWLKGRANPAVSVQWQPHTVWMSCDGLYAVTRGAWTRPGATGEFATVWQRQKKGDFKWLLDFGVDTEREVPAPEMLSAKVAECRPRGKPAAAAPQGGSPVPPLPAPQPAPQPGQDARDGRSADTTLQWTSTVGPGEARSFTAWMWNGSGFDPVVTLSGRGQ